MKRRLREKPGSTVIPAALFFVFLFLLVLFMIRLAVTDWNAPGHYVMVHTATVQDTSYDSVRMVSYDGGKTSLPVTDHVEQYRVRTDVGTFEFSSREETSRFLTLPLCLQLTPRGQIRQYVPVTTCEYADIH